MVKRTVNDLILEIQEIVISINCNLIIETNKEPEIGQIERILETVSFIFEDYRVEFDDIESKKTGLTLTEEQLKIERKLIISWISLSVLNELRKTKNTYQCTELKTVLNPD